MKKNKLLITGGAGYIGHNLISFFLKKNFKIYVIDNFLTSKSIHTRVKRKINFSKIDLTDESKVKSFFKNNNFDLIIHLAGFSGVKEFNKNIARAFNNNVAATKNLVKYGFRKSNTNLIFASSAAVYGKVLKNRVNETTECNPANYYGLSKLACEKIINNELEDKINNYAILRYFNVVGSIHNFKIVKKINSLFDTIFYSIKKKKYKININGKDNDTRDGTPERDFIHVKDLCEIHAKTINYLKNNKRIIVNCGSGVKYSVFEVVKAFEKRIKTKFKITYKVTNSDETQTICSNIGLAKDELKVSITKKNLHDLIESYL